MKSEKSKGETVEMSANWKTPDRHHGLHCLHLQREQKSGISIFFFLNKECFFINVFLI